MIHLATLVTGEELKDERVELGVRTLHLHELDVASAIVHLLELSRSTTSQVEDVVAALLLLLVEGGLD